MRHVYTWRGWCMSSTAVLRRARKRWPTPCIYHGGDSLEYGDRLKKNQLILGVIVLAALIGLGIYWTA